MPKVLLHICCGPCATAIIEYLQNQGYEVVAFFYNPNIQPFKEHQERLVSLENYLQASNIEFHKKTEAPADYDKAFCEATKGSPEKPERCEACYRLRLEETARQAAQLEYDAFTTTLLSSPQQDIDLLRNIGEELANKYEVKLLYPPPGRKKFKGFRSLFTRSRQLAKESRLYEQDYCGCQASANERFAEAKEK